MGTVTKTLLQNLEVLSAGQDYKKDAEGKPIAVQVVNMLVTPEQAEQLSLASNQTAIQLILRNPLDHDVAKTPGTALSYLFTGMTGQAACRGVAAAAPPRQRATAVRASAPRPAAAAPVAPAKKEPPFVMEIISGTRKAETKFDNGGEGK